MKGSLFRKLAAGVLAAAMVVTAVPAVSQAVAPTVTAQAKKKKKTPKAKILVLDNGDYTELGVGKNVGYYFFIENGKSKAKYSFTTNSKNLSVKYKKNGDYVITAKKTGTYKVTGKEKYKGKTRKLNTVKVKVYPQEVKDYTCYLEDEYANISSTAFLKHPFIPYTLRITSGKELVKKIDDSDPSIGIILEFKDNKTEGTIGISVTDGYDKNPKTGTITLKHNNCTGIKGESSITTYVGDEKVNLAGDYDLISDYFTEKDYERVHAREEEERNNNDWEGGGYNDTDPSHHEYMKTAQTETITSADPSIFAVTEPKTSKDSDGNEETTGWTGKGLKEGQTSITITCNGFTLTIPVTVKENHCKAIYIGTAEDDEALTEDSEDYISISEADEDYSDDENAYDIYNLISLTGDDEKHRVTDEISNVTVADPSIVKVEHQTESNFNEETEEGREAGWYITGLKSGDTTITVTCGDVTREMPIRVGDGSDD